MSVDQKCSKGEMINVQVEPTKCHMLDMPSSVEASCKNQRIELLPTTSNRNWTKSTCLQLTNFLTALITIKQVREECSPISVNMLSSILQLHVTCHGDIIILLSHYTIPRRRISIQCISFSIIKPVLYINRILSLLISGHECLLFTLQVPFLRNNGSDQAPIIRPTAVIASVDVNLYSSNLSAEIGTYKD